jgi:branched-chain amino acid aminotransferase
MGDAVFEVTRTCGHRPFKLAEHVRRLFQSAAALSIEIGMTPDELERVTLETLALNLHTESPDVDWSIIHNVTRGPQNPFLSAFAPADRRPTVLVSCFPLLERLAPIAPLYDLGIDVVVPAQRSIPGEFFDAGVKSRSRVHYQMANLQARSIRPGSWPVMIDRHGFLTESTSGNVFLVVGGRLRTPRTGEILPGVTRQVVLELARAHRIPTEEADCTVDGARSAEEAFLTSTSIGLLHIRSWDGRTFGTGQLGPVSARLRSLFHQEVGVDFAEQARWYAGRLSPR